MQNLQEQYERFKAKYGIDDEIEGKITILREREMQLKQKEEKEKVEAKKKSK